ncbi:MAG: hypothetical protein HUN04_16350 [Desulfobacter sp.]|nr:MAG: hypothetical protein HUN04_16350 [Desulfobacter sp.]
MNRHTRKKRSWRRRAAVLILLFFAATTAGCRHLKGPLSPGRAQETSEVSAVYALACTGMATAKNAEEFAAALSAMDRRAGLDFSDENPVPLIRALRHGSALMEKADKKADKSAQKSQARQHQLKQKIKALEKEVATLKHQITVLENIDQERREKRKTQ